MNDNLNFWEYQQVAGLPELTATDFPMSPTAYDLPPNVSPFASASAFAYPQLASESWGPSGQISSQMDDLSGAEAFSLLMEEEEQEVQWFSPHTEHSPAPAMIQADAAKAVEQAQRAEQARLARMQQQQAAQLARQRAEQQQWCLAASRLVQQHALRQQQQEEEEAVAAARQELERQRWFLRRWNEQQEWQRLREEEQEQFKTKRRVDGEAWERRRIEQEREWQAAHAPRTRPQSFDQHRPSATAFPPRNS